MVNEHISGKTSQEEKKIVTRQYISLIAAMILFVPATLFSIWLFKTFQYGGLIGSAYMFYIGVSSIKNRVSILRPKNRFEYSVGTSAVHYGFVAIVGGIISIILVFKHY